MILIGGNVNLSEFKRGTPVIINETDAPCLRLVALFDKIVNGVVYCEYLTDYPSMKTCRTTRPNEVTKLTDFGYDILISGDMVYLMPLNKESIATYKNDGKKRNWQGHYEPVARNLAKNKKLRSLIKCFNELMDKS